MNILLTLVVMSLSFYSLPSFSALKWETVQTKKNLKQKTKVWHVQVATKEGRPLIYVVQSNPPAIRIFYAHTKYHHPISLGQEQFSLQKVTDVGLAEPLEGRGQVLYLGDRTTRRMLYIVLGKKRIREFPLEPGLQAYKEFVARLHPVAEAERHL
ncbi:MAG: hypothetical protein A2977_03855 [Alphaproteobacteria bacterium RIFCSPLOWO2_01_FULL_45_8]|nr:MAG: hypothetical protein A2065_04790 [Alphaproteobacteria bacterium GWB1_45_5]OFW76517.1 MAG: hypothetical protein A3K20_04665 [Alphaproteobacteria bacterium GWA1_45_9]OFW90311.1 MAG: hypothetical protein A2621_04970 [Alphaproteobacteria bacterium RIFCSPHIGHO2_01_FULL_41_14]OFW95771.1 MAG: hypothetical protein A2977_03855 [Alphaproteobacteria bacterium RIFCSPLOWO2_01_FULL_45_8]HCI48609.1 hypothetical protein [Holosporales bacterium]